VRANGSILISENSGNVVFRMTKVLRAEGFAVRIAETGELAVAATVARRPDVILLGVDMRDLGGIEICRTLKAHEETRAIPVLLIIEERNAGVRLQGLRAGAADFVDRQCCAEELLTRVRAHHQLGRFHAHLESQVAQRTRELIMLNEQLELELIERGRAEAAFYQSERRFRNLADAVPVGIWATNSDNSAVFFNRTALAFAGRTLRQLGGNSWVELVHAADLLQFQAQFREAVARKKIFRLECRMRRADGRYRSILNTGVPRLIDRAYAGHIGTAVDITDFKRAQEQMFASRRLASFDVLAAGIAHDFNNMLSVIFAASDLALAEIPPGSSAGESLRQIRNVAGRGTEVVKNLATYAGGTDALMENVDVSAVVNEMLQFDKGSLWNGVTLHTSLASGLPYVRANARQIHQVVLNLMRNACEALDSKTGRIEVSTSLARVRPSRKGCGHGALAEGNYVKLVVSDTGCGISETIQPLIFDPFYSTKFLGRGLGLSVVQGVARSHGGSVKVFSAPGAGSTFEVLFPCCSCFEADSTGELVSPPMGNPNLLYTPYA